MLKVFQPKYIKDYMYVMLVIIVILYHFNIKLLIYQLLEHHNSANW